MADSKYKELKEYLLVKISCLSSYLRDLYNHYSPDIDIAIIKAEAELDTYINLLKEFD